MPRDILRVGLIQWGRKQAARGLQAIQCCGDSRADKQHIRGSGFDPMSRYAPSVSEEDANRMVWGC